MNTKKKVNIKKSTIKSKPKKSVTPNPIIPKFSDKTFKYFDLAKKNKFNKEWFEKNKSMYEDHVKLPFSYLLQKLNQEIGKELKKIEVSPKKITRPLRPSNKAKDLGWVKNQTHTTLWEAKTSIFEWNPGIHIQFGSEKDDNLIAVGLYMVSSRQLYKFRDAAFKDYEALDKIVNAKNFKSSWGTEFGDKYKRFPKGYDPNHPAAKYIWHKQFYVHQMLTRKDVISPKFIDQTVQDFKIALPYFNWIRQAVGTYQRVHRED